MKTFKAPGRTELGGNHTDHQHGKVLCGAVDMYITAEAEPRQDTRVCIRSEGYPDFSVDLTSLEPKKKEQNSSAALIRGIARRISDLGFDLHGFDAQINTEIPPGCGLSSSAAFEVLIGRIFNDFCCKGRLSPVDIAKAGQYAENVYFGKPCGLMDQMACSTGGVVAIDFKDPEEPAVEKVSINFEDFGFGLCIIDTGSCHEDLTDDYASIPADMKSVAACFGKQVLADVKASDFAAALPDLVQKAKKSDSRVTELALSRVQHFFDENERVPLMKKALQDGRIHDYLTLVKASGSSSENKLRNLVPLSHPDITAIPDTIRAAERILGGDGAVRVHGGGFAGCIQAYVPLEKKESFQKEMEALRGTGCVRWLKISE